MMVPVRDKIICQSSHMNIIIHIDYTTYIQTMQADNCKYFINFRIFVKKAPSRSDLGGGGGII